MTTRTGTTGGAYELSHLRALEAEAIHVMREVAAELERPVLLFSGGKDSIVLLRLAEKAFRPGGFPFPLMHVDTGHNFPEVIEFRDRRMAELGERLIVASVQESIDEGRAIEETGPRASRNRLQTVTLLDAIAEHGFDAAFGGARRDEERARAKERVFSFRDDFGQWDPKAQRPELWNLYNGRIRRGEHVRVFPISNWTELDVWRVHRRRAARDPVDLLRARARGLPPRRHALRRLAVRRADGRRGAVHRLGALPHGRRHERARAPWSRRRRRSTAVVAEIAATRDHRARRDARRRPRDRGRDGGPQARGLLLMAVANVIPAFDELSNRPMDLLRFATAGSVDDGKTTLIGRLLYDSKPIFEDQLEHVRETSERRGDGYVDLALLTDGLRAEREQGITIDVAYRYFATPRRRFIIADTPGHEQYTRNMVTGASTADLALVLVDARNGVVEQSRRHAFIASLLGIPHIVVCVNKMDLVGYYAGGLRRGRRGVHRLRREARRAGHRPSSRSRRSTATTSSSARSECPGTRARRCSTTSSTSHIASDRNLADPRFPVQWVIRPMTDEHHDYRGYAGQVASGVLRVGDEVTRPARRRAAPASPAIDTFDGPLEEAFAAAVGDRSPRGRPRRLARRPDRAGPTTSPR